MEENEEALRHWYRFQIHEKHREANRLAIEVGLDAQDQDDLGALAETVERLDTAVEILSRARKQLVPA